MGIRPLLLRVMWSFRCILQDIHRDAPGCKSQGPEPATLEFKVEVSTSTLLAV